MSVSYILRITELLIDNLYELANAYIFFEFTV